MWRTWSLETLQRHFAVRTQQLQSVMEYLDSLQQDLSNIKIAETGQKQEKLCREAGYLIERLDKIAIKFADIRDELRSKP